MDERQLVFYSRSDAFSLRNTECLLRFNSFFLF